ncbi:cytoskeletal protein CcmA (bactofilin family) [Cryobacterium sp. CAN_C3]|uniref:nidogen-like domain-containing protein n=1 Tax=unclassified Cryobacterium TaxID=2649013 RepID=UPI0018C932A3|nr:nidogen-like domain-containing protein [Cryobacterium sp. CAN_C3]MEC5155687.1 cytoskeletal protein CcmA (bactofilin family) [Cryobacterium sp. CAN_C3]
MQGRKRVRLIASVIALSALIGSTIAVSVPAVASDAAIVPSVDCSANTLPPNDDGSSSKVTLPFSLDFYGQTYDGLYVNNNGNVSFGAPLNTYTPFGLASASVPLIAPFFADVDTGGSGSQPVQYGYGETTYEGRPAFCVNWLNVGYFSNHFDKLNSFQLLLVSRQDKAVGAFDIVFNYDTINWETGDASGGSEGLGGVSARVGFTAGTGQDGTFTEFAGSGTPGVFLDGGPTPLNVGQQDSSVRGRYIFSVRNGGTLVNGYVALGDSYQSGEGTFDYIDGTDVDGINQCHRSDFAYPSLLVDQGVVKLDLDFRACSGATVSTMLIPSSTSGPPWNDGIAQVNALDTSTRLVTVGIIGNDLGFGDFITKCVTLSLTTSKTCENELGSSLKGQLTSLESGALKKSLIELYRLIRAKAPNARVVVVSYPHFFPEFNKEKNCGLIYRTSDQTWMNSAVDRADTAIGVAARSAGFEYANMADSNSGFEMCTSLEAMNGIKGTIFAPRPESYHPNKRGHELMARKLELQLGNVLPTFEILPQQTIAKKFRVLNKTFTVNVGWPGSDVRTSLTSPSGRNYSRDNTQGAEHGNGETWEYYTVHDAEPGEWTVEMYGLDVAQGGEPVSLDAYDEAPVNALPTAVITVRGSGHTYTFDASASTDPDGTIQDYSWDFGDGEVGSGTVVTHNYAAPGDYRPSLVTTDNARGRGFGVAATSAVVSETAVLTHSKTTLTNQLQVTGGDVVVDGDVTCTSEVHITGSLKASGDIYLTNDCTIDGDVSTAKKLRMNSKAKIGGNVNAGGAVILQKTVRIAGNVNSGMSVSSIDGTSLDKLKVDGTIGGAIAQNAVVDLDPSPRFEGATFVPSKEGFRPLTWSAWLNDAARSNSAPSWSPALTPKPGCVMAPWSASVNGPVVAISQDTIVDARLTTTGCSSVKLQGMTVSLSGDLVLYADSIEALSGTKFNSGDGQQHFVDLVVPGLSVACQAGAITLASNTSTDSKTALKVVTPGTLSINGPTTINARGDVGCFKATGAVTVHNE